MAFFKQPFTWTYIINATSSTETVDTERVDPGLIYCVQNIGVYNENGNVSTVRCDVYDRAHRGTIFLKTGDMTTTGVEHTDDVYLTESQYLRFTISGLVSGDKVKILIKGWSARVARG